MQAEELGAEVRRRRSATAIANEAFKAATAALEHGRPEEAKELAEVALKGVPDSKPRALRKASTPLAATLPRRPLCCPA